MTEAVTEPRVPLQLGDYWEQWQHAYTFVISAWTQATNLHCKEPPTWIIYMTSCKAAVLCNHGKCSRGRHWQNILCKCPLSVQLVTVDHHWQAPGWELRHTHACSLPVSTLSLAHYYLTSEKSVPVSIIIIVKQVSWLTFLDSNDILNNQGPTVTTTRTQ